ncbi:MAG: hypothetical protein M0P58_03380 [Bacteroidales bacterium]|nr:hypothetical protein [Bacteroidales bacterium]
MSLSHHLKPGDRRIIHHYLRFVVAITPLFWSFHFAFSSGPYPLYSKADTVLKKDTLFLKKGVLILTKSFIIPIQGDTFITGSFSQHKKKDTSFYMKSQNFYDSVYKKFSRKKITQLLYNLAFIEPTNISLPDSVQVMKSPEPFEQYNEKIIRKIKIKVLQPFGQSIYDTASVPYSGAGRTLNSIHVRTRQSIIRNNLLFKEGQCIDPTVMADNERILRDLPYIDNARILISAVDSCSDSVDLVVITKDVWSIGIDVPVITATKVVGRVYDANFLGLGDRFSVDMSTELNRAPFFRLDGISYTFANIAGTKINALLEYYANNEGDQSYEAAIERPFLTNRIKWAGGADITLWKDVENPVSDLYITSRYVNEGFWLGRAFQLQRSNNNARAVVAAAIYRKNFYDRPEITIDSNRNYYNSLQILTSFSISSNNFYVTDYVLGFGKIENLPYGHLFQITVGWDQTDFYDRLYSGISLSAGKFIDRFGYLSGCVTVSGFLNKTSFEDGLVKAYAKYFMPLIRTNDKKYKFRTYFIADYRYGFNLRSNYTDYYDINQDFKINKVNNDEAFEGVHALSANIRSVCFTPWFFYGFRFALSANIQTGLVAPRGGDLLQSPLFSGFGFGLLIKNDNLIFPTFMVAGYYYPNAGDDVNSLQFYLTSDLHMNFSDYNVTAPHEESLDN